MLHRTNLRRTSTPFTPPGVWDSYWLLSQYVTGHENFYWLGEWVYCCVMQGLQRCKLQTPKYSLGCTRKR